MKRCGLIAISIAVMDQLIKMYVRRFPVGQVFYEIEGILTLEYCINTGAAFSVFSGHSVLILLVSVALLASIFLFIGRKLRLTVASRLALACLLGGGMGNLIDRLLYLGVTDYIRLRFIDFPVFNLADIAIVSSIIVLLILLFTDTLEETVEERHGTNG